MGHRNAVLTVAGRRLLVERVEVAGWSVTAAAEAMGISRKTAYRWLGRFRAEGAAGLVGRSSRPRRSPRRTPMVVEEQVCRLRRTRRWGPHRISYATGIPRSTVYRILCRYQLNRLDAFDRPTGQRIRRYERSRPGELVHIDVKKVGRIPDGGGWRVNGVEQRGTKQRVGWDFLHVAVDDHSRVAYLEVHGDEKADTCAQFLRNTVAWFAHHGVPVTEVMTDNALAYTRSRAFQTAVTDLGLRHRRTRFWRPQTNGKVERFHRTLMEEWGYARPYRTNQDRLDQLATWLTTYNHHRPHTALGGNAPADRL